MADITDSFSDIMSQHDNKWQFGQLDFFERHLNFVSRKEKNKLSISYENITRASFVQVMGTFCLKIDRKDGCFGFYGFKKRKYEALERLFRVKVGKTLTFVENAYKEEIWSQIKVKDDFADVCYEGNKLHIKVSPSTNASNQPEDCCISFGPKCVVSMKINVGEQLGMMTNLQSKEGVQKQLEFYQRYMISRETHNQSTYEVLAYCKKFLISIIPTGDHHYSLLYKASLRYDFAMMFRMALLSFDIRDVELKLDEDFEKLLGNLPANDVIEKLKRVYRRLSGHAIDAFKFKEVFDEVDESDKQKRHVMLYPLKRGLLIRSDNDYIYPYHSVEFQVVDNKTVTLGLGTGENFKFSSFKKGAYESAEKLIEICNQRKMHKTMSRIYDDAYYAVERRKNIGSDEENEEENKDNDNADDDNADDDNADDDNADDDNADGDNADDDNADNDNADEENADNENEENEDDENEENEEDEENEEENKENENRSQSGKTAELETSKDPGKRAHKRARSDHKITSDDSTEKSPEAKKNNQGLASPTGRSNSSPDLRDDVQSVVKQRPLTANQVRKSESGFETNQDHTSGGIRATTQLRPTAVHQAPTQS